MMILRKLPTLKKRKAGIRRSDFPAFVRVFIDIGGESSIGTEFRPVEGFVVVDSGGQLKSDPTGRSLLCRGRRA